MAAKTKPLKPGRTERQVLEQIIEASRMLGLDLDRQNTGAGTNPSGKLVRFGKPGDSDMKGVLPDGRALMVEVKREHFDPSKLRGEKREHFDRQLARLQRTNEQNGVGFWTDDSELFIKVIRWCIDGGSVSEPGDGAVELIRR